MNEFLKKQLDAFNNIWDKLSGVQRGVLIAVPFLLFSLMGVLVLFSGRVRYVRLYDNLPLEEGGAIVEKLNELKISYPIGKRRLQNRSTPR